MCMKEACNEVYQFFKKWNKVLTSTTSRFLGPNLDISLFLFSSM